jgi:hypothetical protein
MVIGKDSNGNIVRGSLEHVGKDKIVVGVINDERVVGIELASGYFRVVGQEIVYTVGKF